MQNTVIMGIQTLYKKYTGSFSTGGRSFLLCSVLLFVATAATFIWLSTHAESQRMLKYMLYSVSVLLVMLGLVAYSIFAFRKPEKASKFLWIPLAGALVTFIAALMVKNPEPVTINFYEGSPSTSQLAPNSPSDPF